MRLSGLLSVCLLAAAPLAAQNSQPSLENDQVILNAPHPNVDVPGASHKMHDHKLNRVMVYLHPGGEVLHYGDGKVVDLKWKQGEVKWSPASGPHYSVVPPELDPRVWKKAAFTGPMLVDIGIKKPGNPAKVVIGPLDGLKVDPKDFKLELENDQVRVIRFTLAPHAAVPAYQEPLNSLEVCITDGNIRVTLPDGKTIGVQHKVGDFAWHTPSKVKLENLGDQPFEAVFVEFKN